MTTPVTMVTKDATLDNLSLSDYQDMVVELRQTLSLDKLIAALNSEFSKPLWAKVEKGEAPPNRKQRNELRRYYGMPPLPPTVAESTAAASPDAAVWQVGEGVPEHVIMVTNTTNPLTLHVNGSVTVGEYAQNARNPGDNTPGRAQRSRRYVTRPTPSTTQVERFNGLGVTWRDVIDAGLAAIEKDRQL
jgi:hypothetical protein